MLAGWLESNIVSILTVGASVVYFVTKIDSSNKAQKTFFESEIKHLTKLIELNHANLQGEIQRLKEKNDSEFKGIKEDINRLEVKSDQANHVRERVSVLEASAKSAHNRIDRLEKEAEE